MPVTLLNQTIDCLQYQFMLVDVPAGMAYPAQILLGSPNPSVVGVSNSAVAIGASVVVNRPTDDTILNYLTVALESGQSIVTLTPRWVGSGVTGKATDLGPAYSLNTVSGQYFRTPRPRGAYGISRGAGVPANTVNVEVMPF